jgi:hypothetical protein
MPTVTDEQWKIELLIKPTLWTTTPEGQTYAKSVAGASQATVSMLSLIYDNPSTQLALFLDRLKSGLDNRIERPRLSSAMDDRRALWSLANCCANAVIGVLCCARR